MGVTEPWKLGCREPLDCRLGCPGTVCGSLLWEFVVRVCCESLLWEDEHARFADKAEMVFVLEAQTFPASLESLDPWIFKIGLAERRIGACGIDASSSGKYK